MLELLSSFPKKLLERSWLKMPSCRNGVEIFEHLRNRTVPLQNAGLHFILHDNFRNHRDAT